MSVDYSGFFGVGEIFYKKNELIEYLNNKNLFDSVDEDKFDDDPESCMWDKCKMSCLCLDAYSGNNWFVGYEIYSTDVDTLVNILTESKKRWKTIMQDDAKVILDVKVF